MSTINDRAFGLHDEALSLRAQRTTVLASNIANADTPGYKAQDLDFQAVLNQSMGQKLALSASSDGHIGGQGAQAAGADLKYRNPHQASLDGNTVELQAEQAQFAENTVQYQATMRFLEGKVQSLVTAFKGE